MTDLICENNSMEQRELVDFAVDWVQKNGSEKKIKNHDIDFSVR